MQKTLSDYSITHTISHTISHTIYYCVNCVLDLNNPDANRFETRIFMKKVRVVLKPILGTNLLICPRCGSQHLKPDFFSRNKHYKHL